MGRVVAVAVSIISSMAAVASVKTSVSYKREAEVARTAATAELDSAKSQVAKLAGDNARMAQQIQMFTSADTNQRGENARLSRQNQELAQQSEQLKKLDDAATEKVAALEESKAQLQQKATDKVAELKKEIGRLEDELKTAKEEVAAAMPVSAEVAALDRANERKKRSEEYAMKAQLEKQQAEIAQLESNQQTPSQVNNFYPVMPVGVPVVTVAHEGHRSRNSQAQSGGFSAPVASFRVPTPSGSVGGRMSSGGSIGSRMSSNSGGGTIGSRQKK